VKPTVCIVSVVTLTVCIVCVLITTAGWQARDGKCMIVPGGAEISKQMSVQAGKRRPGSAD